MPDLDALAVIRGGGSLESLQAFDNELLARALFASRIPTVCGIGHHRDVTIASLVSDVGVSTPTGAAKRVNESWDRLYREIPLQKSTLCYAFERRLRVAGSSVDHLVAMLVGFMDRLSMKHRFSRRMLVENFRQLEIKRNETQRRCAHMGVYLLRRFGSVLIKSAETIRLHEAYLEGVSPARNLRLGYSIIVGESGRVIKDASGLYAGESVEARLHKGSFISKVERIYGEGKREN